MRIRVAMLAAVVVLMAGAAWLTAQPSGSSARWSVLNRSSHWSRLSASPAWAAHGAGAHPDPVLTRLGLAPVPAGSRLPGYLMVADRDNNRIIVLSPAKRIVWRFPGPAGPPGRSLLSEPDDAFVSADHRSISINQEFNETIKVVSLSRHPRIVWSYGHADSQGSAHGYLAHPDDAYLLADGQIQVADIMNCRILRINRSRRIVHSIGEAGNCVHDPPAALSDPNGDTPLPEGGVLVTEIGGWIDRFGPHGRLVWSIKAPTSYPSDAQPLPDGDVLVASYTSPGRIDILTPSGRIVWTYEFATGHRALDHPSLAMPLPGDLIAVNDDYDDRVVVIDRATKKIVWQYGHDGVPGSRPGYLNNPDGLELLP